MSGYVDPAISPDGKRQAEVLETIRRLGLTLHRVHRDGRALRLTGPGVHVTVADLGGLSLSDLKPPGADRLPAA